MLYAPSLLLIVVREWWYANEEVLADNYSIWSLKIVLCMFSKCDWKTLRFQVYRKRTNKQLRNLLCRGNEKFKNKKVFDVAIPLLPPLTSSQYLGLLKHWHQPITEGLKTKLNKTLIPNITMITKSIHIATFCYHEGGPLTIWQIVVWRKLLSWTVAATFQGSTDA